MKKNKLFIYTLLSVVGLLLLGANLVSARGFGWFHGASNNENIAERKQAMLERKADLLGISVEELKQGWAEKKSFMGAIHKGDGITDEERKAKMTEYLQILIGKGVITQEQVDERLGFMESKLENGEGGRGFHKGFRRGWHFE